MHEQDGILEVHDARGDERGVLTEAMAARDVRLDAVLFEDLVGDDAHREDGGLGVGRELQILGRALEAHLLDGIAERLIRLAEEFLRHVVLLAEILSHADGLRPLAWEYEC